MTTTELIELLKKHEQGGATGRPREVMFEVEDRIIDTDGIEVTGSGDGLITELYLSLPSAQPKKGKWIRITKQHKDDEQEYSYYEIHCSECGVERRIGWRDARFCPNCGAYLETEYD